MGDGFRGVTALVTGASRGLGRAYALELAQRGAQVVLTARHEAPLREVAAQIRERHGGPGPEVVTADLSAPDGPGRVAGGLRDRGLTVGLLVNNAGSGGVGPFLERPLEPQLRSVGLNVGGLLALTHAIGAPMVERGGGGIINVASTAAFQPMPYQAGYAATKAFVLSFTEALTEELRGSGVHVMAVNPGAIATGFFDGTTAEIDTAAADRPETIAARSLDDYARRRTVSYPGWFPNRMMTWPARLLPRRTVVRLAGAFNRWQRLHRATDLL